MQIYIFNPTIPGAPNPPGKNRVKVEFAHGPHNLYLSIAVEIVLQGNLLYSVVIGDTKIGVVLSPIEFSPTSKISVDLSPI